MVLAILLGRPLRLIEYPKATSELIAAAVERIADRRCRAGLHAWLEQALHLQSRAMFGSAADASDAFAELVQDVRGRRAGALALHAAVRRLLGETEDETADVPSRSAIEPRPSEDPAAAVPRAFGLLRHVIPLLRAN
jgi:hypothetical protein